MNHSIQKANLTKEQQIELATLVIVTNKELKENRHFYEANVSNEDIILSASIDSELSNSFHINEVVRMYEENKSYDFGEV